MTEFDDDDLLMDGTGRSSILLDGDDDEDDDDYNDEVGPMMSTQQSSSSSTSANNIMASPPNPKRRSIVGSHHHPRRRRRSSARFLHSLGSNRNLLLDGDDGDENTGHDDALGYGENDDILNSTQNINTVYKQAIRMNAENKINASNSWNLSLIDHLDRVTLSSKSGGRHGTASTSSSSSNTLSSTGRTMDDSLIVDGVNFTKASCTLDASVKIYSYRVDDVHLTSYKVLANLNRTDHGSKQQSNNNNKANKNSRQTSGPNDDEDDLDHDDDGADGSGRSKKTSSGTTNTLERNLANINLQKLDSAFDVDPLFHQVSKKFDEGGAKGLLLANLGVDINGGARIIFDSSLDDDNVTSRDSSLENQENGQPEGSEGTDEQDTDNKPVSLASLQAKLDSQLQSLGVSSLQNLELVPQLASLRLEHFQLNQEGFVDENQKSSARYASSRQEEAEADKSIHLEAIERSRVSQADLGGRSFASGDDGDDGFGGRFSTGSFPSNGFEPDDFGAADFDLDDGGGESDNFFHDGDHRFSSASFQAGFDGLVGIDQDSAEPSSAAPSRRTSRTPAVMSQATVLLDAIASGDISTTVGHGSYDNRGGYEYYDNKDLERLVESSQFSQRINSNMWAGAEHWKKGKRSTVKDSQSSSKDGKSDASQRNSSGPSKKKTKKASNRQDTGTDSVLIDITVPIANLNELVGTTQSGKTNRRGNGKSKSKSYTWTDAAVTKHAKTTNLLPHDAGLTVGELSKLFLRPKVSLAQALNRVASQNAAQKTVGFSDLPGHLGADDTSFGYNDDEGIGFDFVGGGDDDVASHGSNDFVVAELDGVRKVNKINVGYATVAKKVDVKRLKRDLWTELEESLALKKHDGTETESVESEAGEEGPDIVSTDDKDIEDDSDPESMPSDSSPEPLSFQSVVGDMQESQAQGDVTLPFYFICMLHLCNEKGLALESCGLNDFRIHSSADAMADCITHQE